MNINLLSQKNNFSFLVCIVIPILLLLPVLLFSLPIITLGTDDLMMIKHFNADEAILIKHAGKIYSKIFTPIEENSIAPQFFNYVAGIVLFSYTFMKGVNHQVIAIGLRELDLLLALISTVFIYFFCIRFFKSILIGILSSLLFSTTPAFLLTLLASRPHPLEILFLFIAFYFCFSVLEKPDKKSLFLAIFFSGLATATKFGGIFMIPTLLVTYMYSIWKSSPYSLNESLKRKAKSIYIISVIIMFCSASIPFIALRLYLKIPEKFLVYKIHNLFEFIHSRSFRLLLLMVASLFLYALLWIIINFLSNKYSTINFEKNKRIRYLFIVNKSFLFLFYIVLFSLAMLFILNPHYFLFPKETLRYFVRIQLAKMTMGTAFNPGLNKPIFDSGGLIWLKMIFDDYVLNKWFALLFLFYFFYEVYTFRKSRKSCLVFTIQKGLFWLYGLILLLFLVIFVSHKPHHYLIPIATVMGILISFAIFQIPKQFEVKLIRYPLFLIFVLILCFGFYRRTTLLVNHYNIKRSHNNKETGILIGNWLKKNFDNNCKIWTDSHEFYIPPSFKNVSFMYSYEDINNYLDDIDLMDADILLITNAYDSYLQNAAKVNEAIKEGALKSYQLVKSFDYKGHYAKEGVYKKVFVYSKSLGE